MRGRDVGVCRVAITHGGDVFAVAREHGWDLRTVLDFSASINPLGPSKCVQPAICGALDRIVHYPEREPVLLRRALADSWGLDEAQILLGNGATELIFFVARMFRAETVTLGLPVFSEFYRAFPEYREAELRDAASWPKEGLLVLTRPANPTGWSLPLEVLRGYLERSSATVLMDESFIEFSGLRSTGELIREYPRLMVLRSLTKFYALPGIRVGALVGDAGVIRKWKEHREPWQVNVLAEAAALAAVGDTEHAAKSVEFVRGERVWLADGIRSLRNAEPLPTDANFLFVKLRYRAEALAEHLLRHRILVRVCEHHAVRVAVRSRDENERLLQAWREFTCD